MSVSRETREAFRRAVKSGAVVFPTVPPLDREYVEVPLPELAAVHTYASGPTSNPPLCLATRWEPGDPQPLICARAVHLPDDPRHLTYHYGNYEQTTWTEEDQ